MSTLWTFKLFIKRQPFYNYSSGISESKLVVVLFNPVYLISFRTPKNQPESISVNVRNRIPVVSSKSSLVRKGDLQLYFILYFPLGTIPILLQQREWVDDVRKMANFADIQHGPLQQSIANSSLFPTSMYLLWHF